MAAIKSSADIARKWARVTPARTEDYKIGITNPSKDWATETAAAEDRYITGVTEAAQAGRFGAGVAKAGTTKWSEKAIAKGIPRWGPGVQIAEADYLKGFAPYRDVIERTVLPPRYAKGDPRNIERVAAIANALHEAKVGGAGAA